MEENKSKKSFVGGEGDNMHKKTVIFGFGQYGKKYIKKCVECKVENIQIIDSDDRLWGNVFMGIPIEEPQKVLPGFAGLVVIAVSDKFRWEIFEQLKNRYHISDGNIRYYTEKELLEILSKDKWNRLEAFFFEGKHRLIDKWLHYFEAYDRFFSKYKRRNVSILEIGVFKGGSLQMWKTYFQEEGNFVKVYGIDINDNCKELEEENVEIFIGSQDDRDFLAEVKRKIGKVDIVIDDGGHSMEQQIVAFEELFDAVNEDGIYLCEDCHTSYMKEYGGAYKGETFVEYSKGLIDYLHAQYSETEELGRNKYSEQIKAITYYDSMIFIEKRKAASKSISIQIENK
jgi:hypothetical protein